MGTLFVQKSAVGNCPVHIQICMRDKTLQVRATLVLAIFINMVGISIFADHISSSNNTVASTSRIRIISIVLSFMAVPDGNKVVSGCNEIRYDACYTLDYQDSNSTEDLASTTKPENEFAHISSLNCESMCEGHTMS